MAKKITKKSLKKNVVHKNVSGKIITVKNADGDSDTKATILIQNRINYTPKVSVIIPVYNVAEYLPECLDSVISQTLKEIEIICVDDGSTDNSVEILKEYANKDSRITVIVQKNLHAGVARNAGLAVAKGKYLSFLDSDDFFEPTLLEENYKIAEKENVDLVFYQYHTYNNDTKEIERTGGINFECPVNEEGYGVISVKDVADRIFTICNPMPWNKLIRKDLIDKNQIRFQSLTASNDVYFSLVALACSDKIALFYKPFVYYRHNRKDSLKNNRDKNPFNFYEAYKGVYRTLNNKNLYDEYKSSFLRTLVSSSFWTMEHTDAMRTTVRNFIKERIVPEFNITGSDKEQLPKHLIDKLNRLEEPEVIISLTSFPARIGTVNQTIESLLNQTMKADRVILWLAPEQFPNKEADLPQELLDLREKGLTIDWYHDIRSYKKLIPALKKYPDAIIVTADDDLIFKNNWLSLLYSAYLNDKTKIWSHRITRLYRSGGKMHILDRSLYLDENGAYKKELKAANAFNKLTGGAGSLYPPKSLHPDVMDEDAFMKLAPTSDDIWFWIQAIRNGYKVAVVDNNQYKLQYVPGSQEESLYKVNDAGGHKVFFEHLNNIMATYKDVEDVFNADHKENERALKAIKQELANRYKDQLCDWYKRVTGHYLNLDNPKRFNEKIQWLKLYASTPIKTRLADKFLVRDWVKEKIGEEYLIPLLGVYDKFEDIDFSKLPDRFVIKCNHGCAYNIIVKDKSQLDLAEVKAKLDKWMSENFAFRWGYELQYRDIPPKIIIEKYIENQLSGGDLYDYKFWCFNGRVEYIQFLSERNLDGLKMAFYDRNWRKQDFVYSYPLDAKNIPAPDNLDKMIELAETLSKNFGHVRVDFYRLDDGTIYLGEMTFTSASGLCKWNDEKINRYFGRLIKLPKLAYNIDTEEYYKLPKKSLLKSYLLLPYYFTKLQICKKRYQKAIVKNIEKQLHTVRIDMKNNGVSDNGINVVTENMKVIKPSWFKNEQGQGVVIEDNSIEKNIKITTIKPGVLQLIFRAPDRRYEGKRFLVYVDYTSIKIDGKELLTAPIAVSHDDPFRYEMPVQHAQTIEVIITQRPHKYKAEELGELILKLNPNSDYIKQNITTITKFLGMYTEKKKEKKSQPQRKIKIQKFCGLKFRVLDKHAEIMGVVQSMRDDMFEAIKLQNDRISSIDRSIQDMKRGMELSISNQTRKLSADIISVNSNVINSLNKSLADVLSDLDKSAKSLQNLFGSTVLMLSNNFVDALKQAADSMSYNFNVMLNDKIIDLNQSLDGKLKQNIEGLHNQLNILATEQSFLKETLDTALGNQISRVIKGLTSVSEFIQNLLKLNSDLSDSLTGLNSSFDDRLNAKYNRLIDRINFVSDLAHKILKNNSDLSDAIIGVNKNIGDGLLQNQQQIINSISSVSDLSQNILEYNKDLSDVISELNQKIEAGTDKHQKTLIENVNSITELIKQVLKYNFDLSKTISGINDSFKDQLNVNNNQLNECIHSVTGLTQKMSQNNSDILNAIAELDKQQSAIKNATEQTGAVIAEIQSGIANDLKSLPIEIETKQRNIAKLYSEPYWANIYHDTIINSTWLKDKSVSPGRWAVSYIVLYVLYRVLNEVKPASILECGLGQSSKLMVQYAQNNNADLIICENNPDWASFFEKNFPGADRYIKLLDVEMVEVVPPYKSRTYVGFKDAIKGKKFNMIMIDGPLGSERYSRPQILDVVDNLADSFVIMLDDMNRIGEQETWGLLKEKLVARGIKFVEKIYSSDKDLGVICSPDLEFLTSL